MTKCGNCQGAFDDSKRSPLDGYLDTWCMKCRNLALRADISGLEAVYGLGSNPIPPQTSEKLRKTISASVVVAEALQYLPQRHNLRQRAEKWLMYSEELFELIAREIMWMKDRERNKCRAKLGVEQLPTSKGKDEEECPI